MPDVIMIRDKPETIFDARDFEYHIEKCMGYEASSYFRKLFEEASLESNTRAFQDILEILTSIEDVLYKQRVNKVKIAEQISAIRKTINNQI